MLAPHEAQLSHFPAELMDADVKCLVSTYFVPGPGNTTVNKTDKGVCPCKAPLLPGEADHTQIHTLNITPQSVCSKRKCNTSIHRSDIGAGGGGKKSKPGASLFWEKKECSKAEVGKGLEVQGAGGEEGRQLEKAGEALTMMG